MPDQQLNLGATFNRLREALAPFLFFSKALEAAEREGAGTHYAVNVVALCHSQMTGAVQLTDDHFVTLSNSVADHEAAMDRDVDRRFQGSAPEPGVMRMEVFPSPALIAAFEESVRRVILEQFGPAAVNLTVAPARAREVPDQFDPQHG